MKELWQVFFCFTRIGALTFGGGYSMLPMLQRELVEKHNWATDEEVVDFFAIAQCLPGLIAVNMATLIGRKVKGAPGGVAAAIGVVSPSYAIIVVIAAFLRNFIEYPVVQNAFFGIRVAVCALIVNALAKLWKSGIKDAVAFCIFAVVFALSVFWGVSPVYLVLLAVASGIVVSKLSGLKKGGAQ